MQGETLRPILFILFIADFDRKLRDAGNEGLNINGRVDLLVSLFADDAVVLTNTAVRMCKLIKDIENYCDVNGLKINTSKTQIVHFRRGGKPSSLTVILLKL